MSQTDPSNSPPPPFLLTPSEMQEVEGFVEQVFGPFEQVLDEIESPDVHIDIIPVPPTPDRPWLALVTMGMSAYPMKTPEGVPPFAEVFVLLPKNWPTSADEIRTKGEDAWWPFRWLKNVARLPIATDSWVGEGHSSADDPPQAVSPNCDFVAFLLTQRLWSDDATALHLQGHTKSVRFIQLVPLFQRELDFRAQHGTKALLEQFDRSGLGPHELADPKRPSVI